MRTDEKTSFPEFIKRFSGIQCCSKTMRAFLSRNTRVASVIVFLACSLTRVETESRFLRTLYASLPCFCVQPDSYAEYTQKFTLTRPLRIGLEIQSARRIGSKDHSFHSRESDRRSFLKCKVSRFKFFSIVDIILSFCCVLIPTQIKLNLDNQLVHVSYKYCMHAVFARKYTVRGIG